MAQSGYTRSAVLPHRNHFLSIDSRRAIIGKNQNTFAKRQREMEKRAKADAKRAKKLDRKLNGPDDDSQSETDPGYGFPVDDDADGE